MLPFAKLIPMMLSTFFSLIMDWMFWVIVLIVAMQYRKMARTSEYLLNLPASSLWQPVIYATLFGILGGFLGSVLLITVGISVMELGIKYLWIVAVVLMLIQQRFLCFAYAGGVLSLSHLIFGFPQVSVAQIMGLVAILHMVEALLILFSGHLEPLPVYIKTSQGRVVGGFNLQKFWPLPIVALLAIMLPANEAVKSAVAMPDWWPLIKPELLQGTGEPLYMMMPVVAALGYGDIAVIAHPRDKTRIGALELAGYSVVLLALAVLASHVPQLALLAALFGPLGHEFIIYLGQRRELQGEPLFVQPEHGVMVLHVVRNSLFWKTGIRSGDIILALDGQPVADRYEINNYLLAAQGTAVSIEYLSGKRRQYISTHLKVKPGEILGYVPVPEDNETSYLEVSRSGSILRRWLKRIRGRRQ